MEITISLNEKQAEAIQEIAAKGNTTTADFCRMVVVQNIIAVKKQIIERELA